MQIRAIMSTLYRTVLLFVICSLISSNNNVLGQNVSITNTPSASSSTTTKVVNATVVSKLSSGTTTTNKNATTIAANKSDDVVLPLTIEPDTEIKNPVDDRWFFERWVKWADDSYVLSIAFPIVCGLSSAALILLCIVCCSCFRRRCRNRKRRMLQKKLQEAKSIRRLKPADRMKLLAESSDDEF